MEKIEVSEYFSDKFKRAYLFENNRNRRVVELDPIDNNDKKRFISYAKYLWISEYKQEVPEGYDVDHIDNNPRNDVINNLQILLKKDNILKHKQYHPGNPSIELICPICGKIFYRPYKARNRVEQGKTTCSRRCSYYFNNQNRISSMPKGKPILGTNVITGEEIRYNSTLEATRDGFTQQHISQCCNGKQRTHKGYTWRFI